MKAAIEVLAREAGRRVLVMGDMGELGSLSGALHAEVGAFARDRGIDLLLALGTDSAHAAAAFGPAGRHFDTLDALLEAVRAEAHAGTAILVKGSRFMRMERAADALAGKARPHAA